MTREEFQIIVKGLKAVYTQQTFIPDKDTFNVWYELLKDIDYANCNMAAQRYIISERFPPTIADIRDYVFKNDKSNNGLNESYAWSLVRKAISDSSYHSEERFNELPETIQKAVGSANQLRIWATDGDFNDGVVQSNFLRSYRQVIETNQKMEILPQNLRNMIENTSCKMIGEND